MSELEEVRKGVGMVNTGRGTQPINIASSPPDRCNKSPSPTNEDENLEHSMMKVSVSASG